MLKSKIVNQYRYKEFQEIPQSKLWEFVGPITSTKKDAAILETWVNHFQSLKIPFIIIKREYASYNGRALGKFLVTEKKV